MSAVGTWAVRTITWGTVREFECGSESEARRLYASLLMSLPANGHGHTTVELVQS